MAYTPAFRITTIAGGPGSVPLALLPGSSYRRAVFFQCPSFAQLGLSPLQDTDPSEAPFTLNAGGPTFYEFEYQKHGALVTSDWYVVKASAFFVIVVTECYFTP